MIDMDARKTSGTRVIAASPATIFAILADPRRHHEIDGSGTVNSARLSGPERLSLDAKFGMKMTFLKVPYLISSRVKEFEENRRIAWAHFGGHRWRYELEEVDGGTRVTETFDWSTSIAPSLMDRAPYPKSHEGNIAKTLERLERVALADESS